MPQCRDAACAAEAGPMHEHRRASFHGNRGNAFLHQYLFDVVHQITVLNKQHHTDIPVLFVFLAGVFFRQQQRLNQMDQSRHFGPVFPRRACTQMFLGEITFASQYTDRNDVGGTCIDRTRQRDCVGVV